MKTVRPSRSGVRLGLCCQFLREPIKFRTTTAAAMLRRDRKDQLAFLAELCRSNAQALMEAVTFCAAKGIGAFRVNSQLLPLKTHPEVGYEMTELPLGPGIVKQFRDCGALARKNTVRLSFHPDQFVVLNSPNPATLAGALAELKYQAEVCEWIGADVINLHGGGAYGNKTAALASLRNTLERLPDRVRSLLTLENDDTLFTPQDLLPICEGTGVPLVYDVHHHRCLPDGLTVEQATERTMATWNREPLFHLSSPLDGWEGGHPERHADFIDPNDFPAVWRELTVTIEVEAKAKELAVAKLLRDLLQAPSIAR